MNSTARFRRDSDLRPEVRKMMALTLAGLSLGLSAPTGAMIRPALHNFRSPVPVCGPMETIFGTDKAVEESGIGAFLVSLRVAAGVLMIHHGSEGGILPANFGTPGFEGFIDYILKPYFGFLPGDLAIWSAIHDYIEYIGGIFVAIGLLTRPASLALFGSMVAAVYFHLASTGLQGFPLGHVENYSYNFEEPLLYALIFLLLVKTGSGPLAVDKKILGDE